VLFDPAMILFSEIVEVVITLVYDLAAKRNAGSHADRNYAHLP